MNRATLLTFLSVLLVVRSSAYAESKQISEADYQLKSQVDVINIRADGSYVKMTDSKFLILNESGKSRLAFIRLPYLPQFTKIKVLAGSSSLNAAGSEIYHLNVGRIEDREVSSKERTIASTRELILPFTDLTNNSVISYTYQEESVKIRTPGFFAASTAYGTEVPELSDETIFKSEKPLHFKSNHPELLQIAEGRDGNLYTLDIKLKNTAYSVLRNEPLALYPLGNGLRVDVTTAESWNQIARALAEKYNAEIDKKLPPALDEIAKGAQALKSWDDKIDFVANGLISKITYVGFWNPEKGMFLPRSHQEIVNSKNGDSKDLASITVAILRAVGLKADVALVNAAKPFDTFNREPIKDGAGSLPTLDYFNRAIVRVEIPGAGVSWLDPTQLASYPGGVFPDIVGASALTLSNNTNDLEVIPEDPVAADTEIATRIDLGADKSVQETTSFITKGPEAIAYKIAARTLGSLTAESQVVKALLHERKELRPTTASVDSSQPGVVKGTFNLSTESGLSKDRTTYTLEYNPRWAPLKLADKRRLSDLYLGPRGHTHSTTIIHGLEGTDDAKSDCYVLSPWLDLHRSVTKIESGISVEDEIVMKRSILKAEDIRAREYGDFAASLGKCLASQNVSVKTPAAPGARPPPKLDSVEISNATMADAISILASDGPARYRRANEARKILEHVLEFNSGDAEARAWLANAILNLGYISGDQWEPAYLQEALRQSALAIERNPNSALARRTHSMIALRMGDRATALRDFDVAYKTEPSNMQNFVIGANLAKNIKDNAGAEQWLAGYTRAAQSRSDLEDAYTRLGAFYLDISQDQKAANVYDAAIKIDEKSALLWHGRALALWHLPGRLNDAIASEKKALSIMDFSAARFHLASIYLAKVAFTLKLASSPKSPPPTLEQEKEIEGWLVEANAYHPDNVEALLASADYYRMVGVKRSDSEFLKKAADYYGRVLKLDANHFMALEGIYELHNQGVPTIPLDHYNRVPASELRKQNKVGTAAPPEGYPDKPYQMGEHVMTGALKTVQKPSDKPADQVGDKPAEKPLDPPGAKPIDARK